MLILGFVLFFLTLGLSSLRVCGSSFSAWHLLPRLCLPQGGGQKAASPGPGHFQFLSGTIGSRNCYEVIKCLSLRLLPGDSHSVSHSCVPLYPQSNSRERYDLLSGLAQIQATGWLSSSHTSLGFLSFAHRANIKMVKKIK